MLNRSNLHNIFITIKYITNITYKSWGGIIMNSISNNFSMSNLQVYYDKNHIHGSMPHDKVNHDITKMNEMGSKEQMKADCNE